MKIAFLHQSLFLLGPRDSTFPWKFAQTMTAVTRYWDNQISPAQLFRLKWRAGYEKRFASTISTQRQDLPIPSWFPLSKLPYAIVFSQASRLWKCPHQSERARHRKLQSTDDPGHLWPAPMEEERTVRGEGADKAMTKTTGTWREEN